MEWTELHGRLLGRAFERILDRAEAGTMAFVRCLTPDVVAHLAGDDSFAPEGWQVFRVADTDDAKRRTITADGAVERRETKREATLLLVDTDRAGAGMDGIYSASREVDEASLFTEARRLAATEVTSRLSGTHRRYAERAIRKAEGLGGRYSVSPWTAFDFLCRIVAHEQHPGGFLHLLGLWPVDASEEEADVADELDTSGRFVNHLLGTAASGLTIPARIESLRLAEMTEEQRRDLERFLHSAETRPLLYAMEELAGKRHLWAGVLRVENAQDIQSIEIVPWRNRTGKVAKWSGLVEGATDTDPPMFILKPDAASSGDYSNLEIRWKTRPVNLEKGAVDYRVAIMTDMDEEIVSREMGHTARREEKCRFSNDDFSMLNEDSLVSAKAVVSVGNDSIDRQESEEFIVRFGDPPEKTAGGVGKKVRTFSEGLIELDGRESVSAIAENPTDMTADSKGFVLLRTSSGQRRKSFRVFRPALIHEVERQWTERKGKDRAVARQGTCLGRPGGGGEIRVLRQWRRTGVEPHRDGEPQDGGAFRRERRGRADLRRWVQDVRRRTRIRARLDRGIGRRRPIIGVVQHRRSAVPFRSDDRPDRAARPSSAHGVAVGVRQSRAAYRLQAEPARQGRAR